MPTLRTLAAAAILILAVIATGKLRAQPGAGTPGWEILMRAPISADFVPAISVRSIPVPPAPAVARGGGAGHTHAGPLFAYILQGEIESQVEPDPPRVYRRGGFFSEAPGHVHRFLRNLSTTEPAKVIVFQAGDRAQPAPAIQLLMQAPLPTTANQEVSLVRLTLAPGTQSEVAALRSGHCLCCRGQH